MSTCFASAAPIIEAGADSGERLWPFPLARDFDEGLESAVADTLQCTVASEADHAFAAAFLRRFVREGVPWLHLDIAGPAGLESLAHVRSRGRAPAATGFGVRAVVWAVLDHWDALAGPGPRGASDGRFDGTRNEPASFQPHRQQLRVLHCPAPIPPAASLAVSAHPASRFVSSSTTPSYFGLRFIQCLMRIGCMIRWVVPQVARRPST